MPTKKDLLDLQFIEARHRLIELAAFLDRMDRHPGPDDYRLQAMKQALPVLLESQPGRAARILESLSDHSAALADSAPFQGAFGAPLPESRPLA